MVRIFLVNPDHGIVENPIVNANSVPKMAPPSTLKQCGYLWYYDTVVPLSEFNGVTIWCRTKT